MAWALLCIATLILAIKGGDVVGLALGLLSQYFQGYNVSLTGSAIGLGYGLGAGCSSFRRNADLFSSRALLYRQAERRALRQMLDFLLSFASCGKRLKQLNNPLLHRLGSDTSDIERAIRVVQLSAAFQYTFGFGQKFTSKLRHAIRL